MPVFTLKKLLRNKWMVFCLLIGSIVFVAVLSSIPTYTNGVFRRMLIRDLETQYIATNTNPGTFHSSFTLNTPHYSGSEAYAIAGHFENRITNQLAAEIGLPVTTFRKHYTYDRFYYQMRAGSGSNYLTTSMAAIKDVGEHINIVAGRMPSADPADGIIEFIMSRTDYENSDIRFAEPFDIYHNLSPGDENKNYGQALLVGIFDPHDDYFWSNTTIFSSPNFIVDYDYTVRNFVNVESDLLRSVSFYYCFDFSQIRTEQIPDILNALDSLRYEFQNNVVSLRMEDILREYRERHEFLSFMLIMLEIPVLLMLVFYIYMISRLIINHESNEIAVLKSRGAKTTQIFAVYVLQSSIIAMIALITGPPLGLYICRVLGLSNGFMELVQRSALPLELGPEAYAYAAIAVAVFIVVTLIPALEASHETIVNSKRKKNRRTSIPLWQKTFIDVIMLGLSLYSLRLYSLNAEIRELSDTAATGAPVDPLVLTASAIFILGAGLLFLRIFPLIVRVLFITGKQFWPSPLYTTLLSISRSGSGSHFLALFLVFNIGLGLFNATAARTLNQFLEDRIRYDIGADILISQTWRSETISYVVKVDENFTMTYEQTSSYRPQMGPPSDETEIIVTRMQSREPNFEVFRHLEGVQDATKVFKKSDVTVSVDSRNINRVSLMGIIPHEFGIVAWFKDGLLPAHIYEYLNVMTVDPNAVLMSAAMRDDYGFKVGDHVKIGWSEQSNRIDGTVYGFVDYWPSINPISLNSMPGFETSNSAFIITNLNTIHRQMRMEPYSVWLKMEEGATSAALYESINESELGSYRLRDMSQEIIALKNDPLIQGLNGTLTLGFIVTLGITFIGFLIYWILSIRSRQLQFGILRAMGLSRFGVASTLIWEQILVSGTSVAAGLLIGATATRLFMPVLQLIYPVSEQVPPFITTVSQSDYTALFVALGIMLVFGIAVLVVMTRRLKIDQVLKLGED